MRNPDGFGRANTTFMLQAGVVYALWFETAAFTRKDTFWGDAVDKVLRYQTTTDRQLTKAIEFLEDAQRRRKWVEGKGETDFGREYGSVPKNPRVMLWASGSGDQERLAPEPSNAPGTNQVPAELSSEATARSSCAPTSGAVSPARSESSGLRRKKRKTAKRTHRL